MTDKKSRRVVIINNINSDTIDQAIFILKSDKRDCASYKNDNSVVAEAQKIINNYIRQVERLKYNYGIKSDSKKANIKGKLWAVAVSAMALIFVSAVFIITGNML